MGGSKRPVGRSNPTVLALLQAWIPQRCSAPLSDDRQLPRARVADCAHDLQPARGEELRAHGRLVHELVLALPHPLLRREGSGGSARPHYPPYYPPHYPPYYPLLHPLSCLQREGAQLGLRARRVTHGEHARDRGEDCVHSRAHRLKGGDIQLTGPRTDHTPPVHQPTYPPRD